MKLFLTVGVILVLSEHVINGNEAKTHLKKCYETKLETIRDLLFHIRNIHKDWNKTQDDLRKLISTKITLTYDDELTMKIEQQIHKETETFAFNFLAKTVQKYALDAYRHANKYHRSFKTKHSNFFKILHQIGTTARGQYKELKSSCGSDVDANLHTKVSSIFTASDNFDKFAENLLRTMNMMMFVEKVVLKKIYQAFQDDELHKMKKIKKIMLSVKQAELDIIELMNSQVDKKHCVYEDTTWKKKFKLQFWENNQYIALVQTLRSHLIKYGFAFVKDVVKEMQQTPDDLPYYHVLKVKDENLKKAFKTVHKVYDFITKCKVISPDVKIKKIVVPPVSSTDFYLQLCNLREILNFFELSINEKVNATNALGHTRDASG